MFKEPFKDMYSFPFGYDWPVCNGIFTAVVAGLLFYLIKVLGVI